MRRLYLSLLILSAGCANLTPALSPPLALRIADDSWTATRIQAMIDATADNSGVPTGGWYPCGGLVQLPAATIELDRPLKLWGGVRLRGVSKNETILRARAGDAVQFSCRNDHRMSIGGSVEECSVYADKGNCLAIDEDTAWNEGSYLYARQLILAAPEGKPVALRHAGGAVIYFTTLEDIIVSAWKTNAVDLASNGFSINRVYVYGGESPDRPPDGRCYLNLSGYGTVTACRLEGWWNAPQVEMTDCTATFSGNWCEPNRDRRTGGTPYQMRLTRSHLVIDWPFFVQPKNPIALQDHSSLNALGSLGVTDDGGGVPRRENYRDSLGRLSDPKYQAAVAALRRQAISVDATSEVSAAGTKIMP